MDPTLRVLLVEDSPSDAHLLQESLCGSGSDRFEFTRAESLAEARALWQNQPFDILLLDLSLPDSTGRDTFLRARADAPHLPIVVLTGDADEVAGLEALRHGIQDYLIKGQTDGRPVARAIRYAIQRKQMEEAWRQSEERFRTLAAATFEGIAITEHGVILEANEQLARMHGYTLPEIIGKSVVELLAPDDRARVGQALVSGEDRSGEYRGACKDGSTIFVEARGRPITWDGRRVRITAVGDITARKRAAADLQRERDQLEIRIRERTAELSESNRALHDEIAHRRRAEQAHKVVLRSLSEAQETERGRISRELHDRLGQDLTALKLGLQRIRKQGPFPQAVQDSVSHLEQLADGLMRDIHRLAWELRPSALDDLGLEMALRRYALEWSETSSVAVDFHSNIADTPRLPLELETTLYRVAQEALTNVLRHAHAHRVSLLLERRPAQVSLIIEDDGQGFQTEPTPPGAHGRLGLLGMRERVTLVGGTLVIESTPGAGTALFVRLPLDSSPAQAGSISES